LHHPSQSERQFLSVDDAISGGHISAPLPHSAIHRHLAHASA
jgi:hypothetical protein